jgi:replicative DNA helicase
MQDKSMTNYQPEITGATVEAEEALLGAIMIQSAGGSSETIHQVSAVLEPADFLACLRWEKPDRWPRRARVFYAMTQCENSPHQVNVALKMVQLNILQDGDCVQLCCYVASCPCSLDFMDYARAIRDYSIKRQAKELANKGDFNGLRRLTERDLNKMLKTSGRI